MARNPWKTISSKIVYKTRYIKVFENKVKKPNGKIGLYSFVKTPDDSVFIAAITQNNQIYLINQVRYPTGFDSWELPGGNCDGESVLKAGRRELQEETGLVAKTWIKAGKFVAMNGICPEITNVLIAKDLMQTKENKKKEEGIKKVEIFPFNKVLSMIKSGKITDGQTIASILKAKLYLKI